MSVSVLNISDKTLKVNVFSGLPEEKKSGEIQMYLHSRGRWCHKNPLFNGISVNNGMIIQDNCCVMRVPQG